MKERKSREVFNIEDSTDTTRFGAKLLGSDGWGQKWSGEIPEKWELEKDHLIGPKLKNSEGKEYKVNKIMYEDPEGNEHEYMDTDVKDVHRKFFWIEEV